MLLAQPLTVLYDIGMAMLAREAEKGEQVRDSVDQTLDNVDPPEKIEQTRRADGTLEYDPDMEIPGWGFMDPEDMPPFDLPPAGVAAGDGTVNGFDPT
jgi:hypothetical protein